MKNTAGVGVELRQIYSSRRRSHQPNGAPRPTKPNRSYQSGGTGSPFLRWSSRRRERGPTRTPAEIGQKEDHLLIAWRLGQGAKKLLLLLLSITFSSPHGCPTNSFVRPWHLMCTSIIFSSTLKINIKCLTHSLWLSGAYASYTK